MASAAEHSQPPAGAAFPHAALIPYAFAQAQGVLPGADEGVAARFGESPTKFFNAATSSCRGAEAGARFTVTGSTGTAFGLLPESHAN